MERDDSVRQRSALQEWLAEESRAHAITVGGVSLDAALATAATARSIVRVRIGAPGG